MADTEDTEALVKVLREHGIYGGGSDLTYEPGDPRRYLDDGCTCGWRGPYGSRFDHQAETVLGAVLARDERIRADEREKLAADAEAGAIARACAMEAGHPEWWTITRWPEDAV